MKRCILFSLCPVLFTVLVISPGFAAKQGKERVDSLLNRLAIHKTEDTAKIVLYREIAFEYYGIDPKTGIGYGEKGIALAEQLNYRKGLIFA